MNTPGADQHTQPESPRPYRDPADVARIVNARARAAESVRRFRVIQAAPPDPIESLERRCERLEAALADLARRVA